MFAAGLRPDRCLGRGSLQQSPDSPTGLDALRGRGEERKARKGREREGERKEGRKGNANWNKLPATALLCGPDSREDSS